MNLLGSDFKITIDDESGTLLELVSLNDLYSMNWIRSDHPWGAVGGFNFVRIDKIENGVSVSQINEAKTLNLTVKRYIKNEKYYEEYLFKNISGNEITICEDEIGIVFSYNDLFDKKADMLHTRCNSHVWCAEDICNICSVKLDGQKPYLIQKAIQGSFGGYGLLCDICATPNASHDRGNVVLYAKGGVLQSNQTMSFIFEFCFSDEREPISYVRADHYSGFVGEDFSLFAHWYERIHSLSIEVEGEEIAYEIDGNTAFAKTCFGCFGEKRIDFSINEKKTFVYINVLKPLEDIVDQRVAFITQKQQYHGAGQIVNQVQRQKMLRREISTPSIFWGAS